VTKVSGLKTLDIKPKDICSKIAKTLSCGSGAITDDSFELQGLFQDSLFNVLINKLKLPGLKEEHIEVMSKIKENSKKKPI
jgi:translation initiation factor 1 (eIF-1/SUI1)